MTQSCPECGSLEFTKAGFSKRLGEKIRVFRCKDCSRRYNESYQRKPFKPQERDWDQERMNEWSLEYFHANINSRSPEYRARKKEYNRISYLRRKEKNLAPSTLHE